MTILWIIIELPNFGWIVNCQSGRLHTPSERTSISPRLPNWISFHFINLMQNNQSTKYQIRHPKYQTQNYKLQVYKLNVFSRWVSFSFDKVCAFSRLLWNILTHFVHHFTSFNMFSFLVFVHWASSKVMRAPGHSCRLSNYPFSLRKPEKTWE